MSRYAVYLACHSGDEPFSTWLSTRIAEWASLSGRAKELTLERRQGWRFPILVTQAHHAAFDRYLEDWLATRSQPQDEA